MSGGEEPVAWLVEATEPGFWRSIRWVETLPSHFPASWNTTVTPLVPATRLAKAEADRDEALAAIARVRQMHVRGRFDWCGQCLVTYPCPTLRALDRPANPQAAHPAPGVYRPEQGETDA